MQSIHIIKLCCGVLPVTKNHVSCGYFCCGLNCCFEPNLVWTKASARDHDTLQGHLEECNYCEGNNDHTGMWPHESNLILTFPVYHMLSEGLIWSRILEPAQALPAAHNGCLFHTRCSSALQSIKHTEWCIVSPDACHACNETRRIRQTIILLTFIHTAFLNLSCQLHEICSHVTSHVWSHTYALFWSFNIRAATANRSLPGLLSWSLKN